VCDSQNGTGMPPATLAEFTLQGANWNDYYDVSVVDGFNLPLKVTNNVNCSIADCPVDLDADCIQTRHFLDSCQLPDTSGYPRSHSHTRAFRFFGIRRRM